MGLSDLKGKLVATVVEPQEPLPVGYLKDIGVANAEGLRDQLHIGQQLSVVAELMDIVVVPVTAHDVKNQTFSFQLAVVDSSPALVYALTYIDSEICVWQSELVERIVALDES